MTHALLLPFRGETVGEGVQRFQHVKSCQTCLAATTHKQHVSVSALCSVILIKEIKDYDMLLFFLLYKPLERLSFCLFKPD